MCQGYRVLFAPYILRLMNVDPGCDPFGVVQRVDA